MKSLLIYSLSLATALVLTACQSIKTNTTPHPAQHLRPAEQQSLIEREQQQHQQPIIAVVLGSGGARGYAHIGVLEALEQHGIQPNFIVGTSAGSIAGVVYAATKDAQALKQIAKTMKIADVRAFDIGLQGVFDGQKIEDYINQQVNYQPLENLEIPVYVVATQLDNGRRVVFNYGNAGQAVRASVTIPTMFAPVKIGEHEYVDGGLVSPVPVHVAKELGADLVIAVNILAVPHYTDTGNLWGLFNQNINIMQNQLANEEMKYADIVIQPDIREKAHIFDVKSRDVSIQAGFDAALAQMPSIQQKLQQLQQERKQHQATQAK
ncbi:MAG: patatin-like phospholipase family protein [Acinetobacter sp.]|nr:patatin-like phospholipase family protein [Acinetobacter sp.]